MAVRKFTPPLRLVIAGADKKFSTALAGQIGALGDRFSVAQLGQSHGETDPAITALTNADLLVITTDGAGGFKSDHRRLMKVASICGLGNFLLVIDSTEADQSDPSPASQIESELAEYIETLSQSGCGSVSGEMLILSGTDQDSAVGLQASLSKFDEKINSTPQPFRMPVAGGHGGKLEEPSGEISSGEIAVGGKIVILPAARRASITSISQDGALVDEAHPGQSISVRLSDGLVAAPGDMICAADTPVEAADQFETTIIWTSDEPMMSGRPYVVKSTTNTIDASITTIKYLVNIDTDEHVAANQLEKNDIGVCNLSLASRIPFEPISTARQTGRFQLFDMESGELVGTGAIHFALRRASNVHWQALDVNRQTRARLKDQSPAILWFTGLSGSGKSAIANIVEKKLTAMGRHTYTLDGDNIRHGLNRDLGFTDVDRVENIRRIGEVSRLMADCGLITLVSFISPFRSERQLARELAEEGEFIEIYVDTPLEVAEKRDIKGLYKKARAGEIANFTGIDSPYEAPENPEIRVDTIANSAEQAAEMILQRLDGWGMIKSS